MKSPPTPTYFLALLFTGIPPVADLLKHGATYFAELLHYRDAAVAAAAAAGAGPLPVAGIIMIMMMTHYTPYFKFPLHRKRPHIYSPFHLYRPIVRCED